MKVPVIVVSVVVLLVALAIGLFWKSQQPTTGKTISDSAIAVPIDTNIETATLTATEGQTGDGVATRQFVDNLFVFGITAELPEPPTGQVYMSWLVKNADAATAVATGQLLNQTDGYTVEYSSPMNYTAYDEVQVTLQTGQSQPMGTTVVSGAFQNQ